MGHNAANVNNTGEDSPCELALAYLDGRRTESEAGRYLINRDVCDEYRCADRPEECAAYSIFAKTHDEGVIIRRKIGLSRNPNR